MNIRDELTSRGFKKVRVPNWKHEVMAMKRGSDLIEWREEPEFYALLNNDLEFTSFESLLESIE